MWAIARQRIETSRWPNADLVEAAVLEATLPPADAALFFFTHDLMRTPAVLDHVTGAVRGGGRIVAAGAKRPQGWLAPLTVPAWLVMRRYVTTAEGLAEPWDLLSARLDDTHVKTTGLGAVYIFTGARPAPRH